MLAESIQLQQDDHCLHCNILQWAQVYFVPSMMGQLVAHLRTLIQWHALGEQHGLVDLFGHSSLQLLKL